MSAPVQSPCIKICAMDEASGYCKGCFRTLEEVAGWARMDEAQKVAVWEQLKLRQGFKSVN